MPFPFRAMVLSSAVALVPVPRATAQSEEPLPPTLEQDASPSDVAVAQQIRRALTSTDGLSVDARNVQIITRDGAVTLRGQVRDAAERAAIVTAARRVPGVTHIDADLQIQPMDRDHAPRGG